MLAVAPFAIAGSPPHAWGDLPGGVVLAGLHRFTPTRVGRFRAASSVTSSSPVHPHTRGEICSLSVVLSKVTGSPPHAWGDCFFGFGMVLMQRFTPTRVGRLGSGDCRPANGTVHPHTRGEIVVWCCRAVCVYGSPPHAWGDCRVQLLGHAVPRFTPTRVGRLSPGPPARGLPSVHPHTRGEIGSPRYVSRT